MALSLGDAAILETVEIIYIKMCIYTKKNIGEKENKRPLTFRDLFFLRYVGFLSAGCFC